MSAMQIMSGIHRGIITSHLRLQIRKTYEILDKMEGGDYTPEAMCSAIKEIETGLRRARKMALCG